MKVTVKMPVVVDVAFLRIRLPVRFGEEDIPNNFPLRTGDTWSAIIDVDSGKIVDWPPGNPEVSLFMKVCDEGFYQLTGRNGEILATMEGNYVPHCIVPGEYGDYVELTIAPDGKITNWPKRPTVGQFFPEGVE